MNNKNPRQNLVRQVEASPGMVCFCRQVDLHTVQQAIEQGANNLQSVCLATGAGSECGCCQVYIKELLGEQLWQSVSLALLHRYSANYCAFRLRRSDGQAWSRENPGAYVILQAEIDGVWVGRPYAITDDGAQSGWREITIKRKHGGFFTNWLFDHLDSLVNTPLRISASMGGSVFDPDSDQAIVCLIGGVGITPVLALCRLLANCDTKPPVRIDYSAATEKDFFCRDELQRLAQCCDLDVSFRQTTRDGRIAQADVAALVERHRHDNFYICGPDNYKTTVIELLRNCQVTPMQIIDLESSHTKAEIAAGQQSIADNDWSYRLIGVLLLLAYGLQAIGGFKLAALEQLQSQQDYKIFSGLLLATYILSQWRLPMMRWLNRSGEQFIASRRRHKNWGAIAPLVFFLHATSIGYAYLAALSSVYLSNSLLGYGSGEWVSQRYRKAYVFGWTVLHVGLSTGLLLLSGYHGYIALAYK